MRSIINCAKAGILVNETVRMVKIHAITFEWTFNVRSLVWFAFNDLFVIPFGIWEYCVCFFLFSLVGFEHFWFFLDFSALFPHFLLFCSRFSFVIYSLNSNEKKKLLRVLSTQRHIITTFKYIYIYKSRIVMYWYCFPLYFCAFQKDHIRSLQK